MLYLFSKIKTAKIPCTLHAVHFFSNCGNKPKTEMMEGDQVYNFGINAYTHSEHNTSR